MTNKIKTWLLGLAVTVVLFLFFLGSTMLIYRAMAIQGEINAAETSSYYAEAGQ